jgi:hypothetical protein
MARWPSFGFWPKFAVGVIMILTQPTLTVKTGKLSIDHKKSGFLGLFQFHTPIPLPLSEQLALLTVYTFMHQA